MSRLILPLRAAVLALLLLSAVTGAQTESDSTLLRLLPEAESLPAWRQSSEARFFGRTTLFEYIDGAADLYLQYGFRRVLTTDYAVGPDSSSVTVEIYRMKSPLQAFAIYAAERSPDETPVAIGVEGYQSANVLNFYNGDCYIKITSYSLDQTLWPSLQEMAHWIAGRIGTGFVPPALFAVFPEKGAVPASDRYVPGDFLGQSYFTEGYRREYRSDTCGPYQLFLVPCKSVEAARDIFSRYSHFLLQRDTPQRAEVIAGHPAVLVQGPDKLDLVVHAGAFVCGALGAPCGDAIRSGLEEMAGKLAGQNSEETK